MPLILRLTKGSALTYAELDSNFTYLNSNLSSSINGTINTVPIFTGTHAIGNSIIKQVGTSVTINNDPIVVSSQTSSFATTGSNIFTGDQTIIGKIIAQTIVVQTVTSSVIYSSGSNLFGDSLSNNQVLSGSTYLVGSGYLNGVPLTALNGNGFVKANGTSITYDNSTYYSASNPNNYTNNLGTVTSVGGTGTVSGLTLIGTVTTSGSLTLGGTLSLTAAQVTGGLGYTPYNSTNPDGYITNKNDAYTSTAKITDIITLTAAEYAAIGSPSSNILYVII
jgi:hypothetical protein